MSQSPDETKLKAGLLIHSDQQAFEVREARPRPRKFVGVSLETHYRMTSRKLTCEIERHDFESAGRHSLNDMHCLMRHAARVPRWRILYRSSVRKRHASDMGLGIAIRAMVDGIDICIMLSGSRFATELMLKRVAIGSLDWHVGC
ncbi:MAG: hypothetical protein WB816_03700 [Methylocystis sp.]